MENAERVKKGLRICGSTKRITLGCIKCPYLNEVLCVSSLASDAAELIALLEERIAIMQESMETLEKRCNTLNALEQRCKELEKRNEPIKPEMIMTTGAGIGLSHCPKCGESIDEYHHPSFCGNCGQAVKWI